MHYNISLSPMFNISSYLKLIKSNTLILDISLLNKFSFFKTLKFTFESSFTSDILF